MIGNVSRRERTFVGLGVLGVAVGLIWTFVLDPVSESGKLTTELVPSRSQVLTRRLDLLARKDAVTKELEIGRAHV